MPIRLAYIGFTDTADEALATASAREYPLLFTNVQPLQNWRQTVENGALPAVTDDVVGPTAESKVVVSHVEW